MSESIILQCTSLDPLNCLVTSWVKITFERCWFLLGSFAALIIFLLIYNIYLIKKSKPAYKTHITTSDIVHDAHQDFLTGSEKWVRVK